MSEKIKTSFIKVLKPFSLWITVFYIFWIVELIALLIGQNDNVYVPLVALFVITTLTAFISLILWFLGMKAKGIVFQSMQWWKWIVLIFIPFSYYWMESSFEVR